MIRLTSADLSPAAETLARAFHRDPLLTHLLPDEPARQRRGRRCLARIAGYGLRYGEAYAASSNMEGVAVWLPPQESKPALAKMLRAGVWRMPAEIGWGAALRFARVLDHLARVWRRCGPPPHWYLCLLGVDPQRQGQGHGKALVRAMLERFDRSQLACGLETTNEHNTAFYQSLGFSLVAVEPVPHTELRFWFMLRPPAGA